MPVKENVNKVLTGVWKVGLCETPVKEPVTWCYGFCCPCCFAYGQRKKILSITNEPYICCAGQCPCCSQKCDSDSPWLCLETCCCTNMAILGNRFMLQTRFNIQNDPCDETILSIVAVINLLAFIISICDDSGNTADACDGCADCVDAVVCSCILTQQDIQIKAIEEELRTTPYAGIPQDVMFALPPQQQDIMRDSARLQPSPPQYGAGSS